MISDRFKKFLSIYEKYSELVILNRGDVILIDSGKSSLFFIVTKGVLQVGRLNSRQIVMPAGFLKKNDCLITKSYASSICQCKSITKSHILILNSKFVCQMASMSPSFLKFTVKAIYKRIIETEEFFYILLPKTIDCRTAALLLFLAKYFGRDSISGVEIKISISQLTIAQILGTSRVSVTRVLKRLQKTNSIKLAAGKITINNPTFLSLSARADNLK